MDRILVIDDLPMISLAFQEVLKSVNPSASVEYCVNSYAALSAKSYNAKTFDLVILGSVPDGSLDQLVPELKVRFNGPLLMLYLADYDPAIIGGMTAFGIDAYVHRFESIDEIRDAYRRLSDGARYISGIFHTLYYEYGLHNLL